MLRDKIVELEGALGSRDEVNLTVLLPCDVGADVGGAAGHGFVLERVGDVADDELSHYRKEVSERVESVRETYSLSLSYWSLDRAGERVVAGEKAMKQVRRPHHQVRGAVDRAREGCR